jgi:hypothetical protein
VFYLHSCARNCTLTHANLTINIYATPLFLQAALALATQPPKLEVLSFKPYGKVGNASALVTLIFVLYALRIQNLTINTHIHTPTARAAHYQDDAPRNSGTGHLPIDRLLRFALQGSRSVRYRGAGGHAPHHSVQHLRVHATLQRIQLPLHPSGRFITRASYDQACLCYQLCSLLVIITCLACATKPSLCSPSFHVSFLGLERLRGRDEPQALHSRCARRRRRAGAHGRVRRRFYQVGSATALVSDVHLKFICVLCSLRAQISQSICNFLYTPHYSTTGLSWQNWVWTVAIASITLPVGFIINMLVGGATLVTFILVCSLHSVLESHDQYATLHTPA